MAKLTIELDEDIIQKYKEHYDTLEKGIKVAIKFWIDIKEHTICEMRRLFNNNEIKFIIDFMDEIDCSYRCINFDYLISSEECYRNFDKLASKHEIDLDKLKLKLNKLGTAKSLVLCDWIKKYNELESKDKKDYMLELTQDYDIAEIYDKIVDLMTDDKQNKEENKIKYIKQRVTDSEFNKVKEILLNNDKRK